MTNDGVLISLIDQSVLGDTLSRRRAASILLRAVRAGPGLATLPDELALVSAGLAGSVANEVRTLVARFGLDAR
jgi:hypothetical protein